MEENKEEKNVNEVKVNETEKKKESNVKEESKKIAKKGEAKKDETTKKEVKKKEDTKKTEKNESKEENKKEDLTFRKVEMSEKNKKKLDEMDKKDKKSHGFAKAVIIIIMILIAAYCIFFVRNLIILNSIAETIEPLKDVSNFTYTSVTKSKDGEELVTIDYYKKDNVERYDLAKNDISIINWYDSESDEKIFSVPSNRRASIENVADAEFVHLPLETNLYNKNTTAFMSLISLIYSEEYNGKDCYVISFGLGDEQKTWIDKETGLIIKREYDYSETTIEYTNVIMNNLTEIYKPDLTGYEVDQNTDVKQ